MVFLLFVTTNLAKTADAFFRPNGSTICSVRRLKAVFARASGATAGGIP